MKKALIAPVVLPLLFVLAACASGKGRVEGMLDLLKPVDVAVAVGIGQMVYEIGGRSVWEAETSAAGAQLYRVTLRRNRFANTGDGEAPLLFKLHAERLAASQSCSGYRIVEFHERYDSLMIGAQRVAEGLIECLRA